MDSRERVGGEERGRESREDSTHLLIHIHAGRECAARLKAQESIPLVAEEVRAPLPAQLQQSSEAIAQEGGREAHTQRKRQTMRAGERVRKRSHSDKVRTNITTERERCLVFNKA